jgi:hypothetical protein
MNVVVEVTLRLTVSQYVLVSSTLVGLATRYYFLSECCCLKFAVLYLRGALSDERAGPVAIIYIYIYWVISVYFTIRNTLLKSGTFLLGHLYICRLYFLSVDSALLTSHLRYVDRVKLITNIRLYVRPALCLCNLTFLIRYSQNNQTE